MVEVLELGALLGIAVIAIGSRLLSILRFEAIIHEFDPWFNYRATEYLVKEGWSAFLNWFDDRSWLPLGRVTGGTLYPGLMVTAAWQYRLVSWLVGEGRVSVQQVCVWMAPVWSAVAVGAAWALARDLSGSQSAALLAAALLAVVPGYISRSVAGSYDNEGMAIPLLLVAIACWCRSLRPGSSVTIWAMGAGLSYSAMAASWGGYVFLANLLPLHALCLLVVEGFSEQLHLAYSVWWLLGTMLPMTIPFVHWQPLSTSEHMAALGLFGWLQLLAFAKALQRAETASEGGDNRGRSQTGRLFQLASCSVIVGAFGFCWATGRIAPWAGRFYSLWDHSHARKHLPIIASVSEHQPTVWTNFFMDLNLLILLLPVGCWWAMTHAQIGPLRKNGQTLLGRTREGRNGEMCAVGQKEGGKNEQKAEGEDGESHNGRGLWIVPLWGMTAAYFASVMIRLILTLAPIMCLAGGLALGSLVQRREGPWQSRLLVTVGLVILLGHYAWHCTWVTSMSYSSPSVIMATPAQKGRPSMFIDDFREAYHWLRHNTQPDERILSWWDYGYQLAGMADRPTIVDNNTWNNGHIARVGLILASDEQPAWSLLRQLQAKYVLILSGVHSGFSGDDLNKFLWMVRIAEGEFPGLVSEKSMLNERGDMRLDAQATPTLRSSLLYRMTYYRVGQTAGRQGPMDRARGVPLAGVDPTLSVLEEAYCSEHFIVRLYRVKEPDVLGRSFAQIAQSQAK